jgi:hypothetical protein
LQKTSLALKDVLFWQKSEVFPCTIGADMFKQRKVARLTQSATVTDFHQIEKTISAQVEFVNMDTQ